jgi:thiol-disulfide isomerase/thioredoxin
MRRRELLAGVGSVSALGAAGVIALRGGRSIGGDGDAPVDSVSIETIDAPGSEAGEIVLPSTEQPTFIDFFATWCGPCETQMPALAEANDRIGDEVLFISVTWEGLSDAEIAEWWAEYGGDWLLGRDRRTELNAEYSPPGIPYAVAIDESGVVRWSDRGAKSADELVSGIEHAIDNE